VRVLAVYEHLMLVIVDGKPAGDEFAGAGETLVRKAGAGVPDGDADTREQLRRAEWLGYVVVRSLVQRLHLVALVGARGDDDYRDLRPLADGAYDVHAVHVGQTEVEDYQVRAVRAYHGERFGAGMRQNDVIAVCSQDRAYEAGDTLFIFYY